MRVLRGLKAAPGFTTRSALGVGPVVTIGMFDGMHAAHQQLIRTAVTLARRLHRPSLVLTFSPDPQLVLTPGQAPPALMPLDVRMRFLEPLGIDAAWILAFTKRFSRMSAKRFLSQMLIRRLHPAALVIGENFMFGRDRRGGAALLRDAGRRERIRIRLIRPIRRAGGPISSSRIRRLITSGELKRAARLLGRPPALYGRVRRGAGRATRLGFPTANVRLLPQVLPPRGVYAVAVRICGRMTCRAADPAADRGSCWCRPARAIRGVMNLGVRPTFGTGPLTCEVHLLGFSGELHGRSLEIQLVAKLRDERRFATPHALATQIRRDIAKTRRLLSHA